MAVKHRALERSMAAMTFGVAREMAARKEDRAKSALSERDMQFQVPISGTAGTIAAWGTVEVKFRVDFVAATSQRESPYALPQFTWGAEIGSVNPSRPEPPLITCCVTDWDIDDREVVRGATVSVAVWAAEGEFDYHGKLHLNFQGYGAPYETDMEDD